jgi:hypothetical protein
MATASSAFAGDFSDCSAAAKNWMSEKHGQLLSLTLEADRCSIVFLMHREGARPKRIAADLMGGTGGSDANAAKRSEHGAMDQVQE